MTHLLVQHSPLENRVLQQRSLVGFFFTWYKQIRMHRMRLFIWQRSQVEFPQKTKR